MCFTISFLSDLAASNQWHFQSPASLSSSLMVGFHDLLTFVKLFIGFLVFYVLASISMRFCFNSGITFNSVFLPSWGLEFIWTIIPAGVLVFIGFPSFELLYLLDNPSSSSLFSIHCIANQWYWSVQYCDFDLSFDKYKVPSNELESGAFSLLAVDHSIVVPMGKPIEFLLSSSDVIHSFAIPSLGINVDCVPGSVNSAYCSTSSTGAFFGQCSELCGVFHGFKPLCVEVVSLSDFVLWVA